MSSLLLSRLHLAARICLALLAFSLPFEALLLSLGPLQVTNLEILLALLVAFTVILVLVEQRWRHSGWLRFPHIWLALWALILLALLVSTLLAPEHRLNAAKASGRVLSGMVLALCIPQLLLSPSGKAGSLLRWAVLPLLLGGALAVVTGLWEVWTDAGLAWLVPFRAMPTLVGPFIRLTGPFDHANQAAMYLEATVPFVLAIALLALHRRTRLLFLLALAATLLWLQALVSTYSRTAVVAVIASALLVAAFRLSRRLFPHKSTAQSPKELTNLQDLSILRSPTPNSQSPIPWTLLALALILLTALNAFVDPVVRMRMRTEGDNEWYNLRFEAPAALQVDAGHTITTTVTVHNEGDLTWTSAPPQNIYLGGHWNLPGRDVILGYAPRWSLPQRVAPGEMLTMRVGLQAPLEAGVYDFRWDMVQEGFTWFSYKNGVRTSTGVTVVEGPPPPTPASPEVEAALMSLVEAPPDLAPIPGRRELWRIAAGLFMERPLTGIGLDNYRLLYGRALDYQEWNQTIHTNNWYVEILVSLGLLGALPTFAWLGLLALSAILALRRYRASIWHAALAAAIFAFLLHGLLDYFLAANATGMLFWMVNGLWVAVDTHPQSVV